MIPMYLIAKSSSLSVNLKEKNWDYILDQRIKLKDYRQKVAISVALKISSASFLVCPGVPEDMV